MKKNRIISILLTPLICSLVSYGQTGKKATDYLTVPGPIVFEKRSYQLNWSSHPAGNFFKQEYITAGDSEDRYGTMIMLDVISGQSNIRDIVAAKIAELKKLKLSNPVVNFETITNPKTGEYMIDFLLSENSSDGKHINIVERNVYRYKVFTGSQGQKAVLLFGVSVRSYGDDIDRFFDTLKTSRKELINEVSQFSIPQITIPK